jgi:hypothetical protein
LARFSRVLVAYVRQGLFTLVDKAMLSYSDNTDGLRKTGWAELALDESGSNFIETFRCCRNTSFLETRWVIEGGKSSCLRS